MGEVRRASDARLMQALRSALGSVGIEQPVRIARRHENVYESSHRSEVIVCELHEGSSLKLLCKYGESDDRNHLGLRRGLRYEATVYRRVLAHQPVAPRYYGSHEDPSTGQTWLFLEYLGEGWQLDLGPETAIADAAGAIGELHCRAADRCGEQALRMLNRYDRPYFHTCLRRARAVSGSWRRRVPAFEGLIARFASQIDLLVSAPKTVIHGEFTPHNVVWADECPRVVDWEEAAIGAGEVDLACLTDEWEHELVELATRAYVRSRWPQGPPHDFARTLEAARLYWVFRWLSDPDETGEEEEIEWITERVNELA